MWTRFLVQPFWTRVAIVAGVDAIIDAVRYMASQLGGYHLANLPNVDHDVLPAIVSLAISYGIVGLMVAAFTSNSNEIYTHALRGLDSQQRSAAVDAALRGPVPADAFVRGAAVRIALRRLTCLRSWRTCWLVLTCLDVLALVINANDGWHGRDPEDWAISLLIPCLAVTAWFVFRRAEDRLKSLGWTSNFDTVTLGEAG